MPWQIFFTHEAEKNLKKLSSHIVERVKDASREIASNPVSAGKHLKGDLKGFFSFRIGDYRIVYTIEKQHSKIYILYIRHRRESYK